MPLSWNEIRDRALNFSSNWKKAKRERSEAQTFWNEFFDVFGIDRKRLASFEFPVKKLNQNLGFIDLFWKGTLLVEHKSRGESLDKAYNQALDYFCGLKDHELPKYVLVSDFESLRLYNLETAGQFIDVKLTELHKKVKVFGFIAGYSSHIPNEQDPANIKAAELMGKLHDQLFSNGYRGHDLEVLLVRILFCLFAEDTGIFNKDAFRDLIFFQTKEDGTDLGPLLEMIFQTLDLDESKRQKALDENISALPYVNGNLFSERISIASFDKKMREIILHCSSLDWSRISPAIFGSMFQSVMDENARRAFGAHYTSEENILKLIRPLFLDTLRSEFQSIVQRKQANVREKLLIEFQEKLSKLKFLDPACGCGNFLAITYREIRQLELETLRQLKLDGHGILNLHEMGVLKVDVDQFYGIEIDEWPARIAEVSLWLVDHQMNLRVSEEFGQYIARLPLKKAPKIVVGNALRTDWTKLVSPRELSFIIGNPPFVGAMNMTPDQRSDLEYVFGENAEGTGEIDYVGAWFKKSALFANNTTIKAAFVATNSITQGQQVGLIWENILNKYKIQFAHRTFKWSNEARANASVFCVIIGIGQQEPQNPVIFNYNKLDGPPQARPASKINPYLLDASNIFLKNRSKPICNVPPMKFGSMPRDGGNLVLSEEEKKRFEKSEPITKNFIKPYIGAYEFINNKERYCLWLHGIQPSLIRQSKLTLERIERVREFRSNSKAAGTRKFASVPSLFCQIAQPNSDYIIVPKTSSERRRYIPIGFQNKNTIASDLVFLIPAGTLYEFGILESEMHMCWVRTTCGRLKSDYRYSKDIVYNNFPWPNPSQVQKNKVMTAAKKVLEARQNHTDSSLADLYDPSVMPQDLLKAHQELDKAVDHCYKRSEFKTDSERMEYLFALYEDYTERTV